MNRLDKIAARLANSLVENEMTTVDDVAEFDVNVAARELLDVVREVAGLHRPLTIGRDTTCSTCRNLFGSLVAWPCPTARAVQALTETEER